MTDQSMTASEFRKLRLRVGITQAELAELWEVNKRTVIRWEQEGPPKMAALLMAAMDQERRDRLLVPKCQ